MITILIFLLGFGTGAVGMLLLACLWSGKLALEQELTDDENDEATRKREILDNLSDKLDKAGLYDSEIKN